MGEEAIGIGKETVGWVGPETPPEWLADFANIPEVQLEAQTQAGWEKKKGILPTWLTEGVDMKGRTSVPTVQELLEAQGRIVKLDKIWRSTYQSMIESKAHPRGKVWGYDEVRTQLISPLEISEDKNHSSGNFWIYETTNIDDYSWLVLTGEDKYDPHGWKLVRVTKNKDKTNADVVPLVIDVNPRMVPKAM